MTSPNAQLLKPDNPVGIVGYGAYVPRFRLPASEVSRIWTEGTSGLPIKEKAVPGLDEDVATMSIEAARNALARAGIDPQDIRAVWEAIGAVPNTQAADWQFACKAGTEAMQAAMGFVGSGMAKYALSVGMDTAQGRPGDALEYTAGAGGAAYLIGAAAEALAVIEGSYSFVSDTPDFWRRQYEKYPEHGQRFTGEPAYFKHVIAAGETLMRLMGATPKDYRYFVPHQPNVKFPQRAAKMLGFADPQVKTGLLVGVIGNTYAGAAMIGLTAVLDEAKPGDNILMVSFGSGAGSDAFHIRVTDRIAGKPALAPTTQSYIARRTQIDYATYTRYRGKLTMK
ncbi:MAG: hydroxymethylglutaryl-CoA synthase [Chloroflexi bacterium]|nr:hydroxymethylglutaryl-CoA synthase [Chloroflexota bacterium]